ncbi:ATP-binding protein [Mycobacterium sp. IDR2000157661]|uniref:ATP-binding protein n=1 Tax=Mycobacterium sp. IDR2000157661 TaxID=2867005 RepID=UPI001EEEB722|nr:ATP-binding protein [Mycobacterium sp. IDR2000157661]ULE34955.1 ATP-binding protein [Mycobacterium sp. IDR2000157661]
MGLDARPRIVDPLCFEISATAERLAQIRHRLLQWIEPLGTPDAVVADIVLAVNEACTNSVEHAYRNEDAGTIEIEASVEGGTIVVCISDHGSWRPPSSEPTTRGRGLPIMEATSDLVELMRSASGTTVRITFHTAGTAQECGSRTT